MPGQILRQAVFLFGSQGRRPSASRYSSLLLRLPPAYTSSESASTQEPVPYRRHWAGASTPRWRKLQRDGVCRMIPSLRRWKSAPGDDQRGNQGAAGQGPPEAVKGESGPGDATPEGSTAQILWVAEAPRRMTLRGQRCQATDCRHRTMGRHQRMTRWQLALNRCHRTADQCRLTAVRCQLTANQCKLTASQCHLTSGRCRLTSSRCQLAANRCQLTAGQCHLTSNQCKLAANRCHLTSNRCQLTASQCHLTSDRCRLTSNRCQLASNRCQLASNRCQLAANRCQLAADRCRPATTHSHEAAGGFFVPSALRRMTLRAAGEICLADDAPRGGSSTTSFSAVDQLTS
jgi:hypothetical protein